MFPFRISFKTADGNCCYSALIGLASVILMLPLPGYIASKIQKINKEKMEKVRVFILVNIHL